MNVNVEDNNMKNLKQSLMKLLKQYRVHEHKLGDSLGERWATYEMGNLSGKARGLEMAIKLVEKRIKHTRRG